MKIETREFGTDPSGQPVTRYTLTNAGGQTVSVMSWGASLLEINVPDRDGKVANVNAVFDTLEPYLNRHPYFGASVGRFSNRIGQAKFTIDGKTYEVTKNFREHHIHGGKQNFTFQNWDGESYQDDEGAGVRFSLTSPDGSEGFPGNVNATVEYRWNDKNELSIRFTATTDKATHLNFTNHSYFNLGGFKSGRILDHQLQMNSDQVLDVDGDLIPTGSLNQVAGTPFDFREPRAIGDANDQLPETRGYDHCFVIKGEPGTRRPAARVLDPDSGRVMEVETTQPGVQLYAAGNLPGTERSAGLGPHEAFCLETQHYPDAPNQPSFPSTLVRPGETLSETTLFRFLTQ